MEDAIDTVDRFLTAQNGTCFLLHGHGTGALKQAVRQWLGRTPRVRSWRPADSTEGGG